MEKHSRYRPLKDGEVLVRTTPEELARIAMAAGEKAIGFTELADTQQATAVALLRSGNEVGYTEELLRKQNSVEASKQYGSIESDALTILSEIPD
jgi:predicted Zn-dependent protease